MRVGERSIPKIKALIAQDSRFAQVGQFGGFTGRGGSLHVGGEVASAGDLADLKQLLALAFPEVNFFWAVRIHPAMLSQPRTNGPTRLLQ